MENWHLHKAVPLTFVLAIALQFIYLVDFLSEMKITIEYNQRELMEHDVRLSAVELNVQGQQVALARIDENIRHIRETVDRVLNENSL